MLKQLVNESEVGGLEKRAHMQVQAAGQLPPSEVTPGARRSMSGKLFACQPHHRFRDPFQLSPVLRLLGHSRSATLLTLLEDGFETAI